MIIANKSEIYANIFLLLIAAVQECNMRDEYLLYL